MPPFLEPPVLVVLTLRYCAIALRKTAVRLVFHNRLNARATGVYVDVLVDDELDLPAKCLRGLGGREYDLIAEETEISVPS